MSALAEMTVNTPPKPFGEPKNGVWLTNKQLRQLRVIAVLVFLWPVTFMGMFYWYQQKDTASTLAAYILESGNGRVYAQLLHVKTVGIDEAIREYGFKSIDELQLKIAKNAENREASFLKFRAENSRFWTGFFWAFGIFFSLFQVTFWYGFDLLKFLRNPAKKDPQSSTP